MHGLFEALHGATQVAAELAQFLGAKDQDDDAEYDQQPRLTMSFLLRMMPV